MTHWNEFDYVVINDDFDRALNDLAAIVAGRGAEFAGSRPAVQLLVRELLV